MKLHPGFSLSVLTAMLISCASLQQIVPTEVQPTPSIQPQSYPTPPLERPQDFSVLYKWSEGSLPPPYYYKYSIKISSSGESEIEFIPNYPQEDDQVPVWIEPFNVSLQDLDQLYELMRSEGLWSQNWQDLEDSPVGAGSESMVVTADGMQIETPPYVDAGQGKMLEEIYAAINALVPKDIFDKLMAKREKYMQEYENP